VGSLTSHNPIGLQVLLWGQSTKFYDRFFLFQKKHMLQTAVKESVRYYLYLTSILLSQIYLPVHLLYILTVFLNISLNQRLLSDGSSTISEFYSVQFIFLQNVTGFFLFFSFEVTVSIRFSVISPPSFLQYATLLLSSLFQRSYR
jgi:hypothetical protein